MMDRFIWAQNAKSFWGNTVYEQALSELRNGRKSSHWIWYIFPQL